jgi:hypothetical protein
MNFSILEDRNDIYKNIICQVLRTYGFGPSSNFPKNTFISGSTVLNLIKNKEIDNNSDLDLYIQKDTEEHEMLRFIETLKSSGFLNSKNKSKENKLLRSYTIKKDKLKEDYISEDHKYFSLKEHIDRIVTIKNNNGKTLDVIIINNSIEDLLVKSFDFDIVKNYIKLNKSRSISIHIYNLASIHSKNATITNTHFDNRIMHNAYEFNNFVKRYVKYSKHYNIYIGKKMLSNESFHLIIKYIMDKIKENTPDVYIDTDFTEKNTLDKGFICKS